MEKAGQFVNTPKALLELARHHSMMAVELIMDVNELMIYGSAHRHQPQPAPRPCQSRPARCDRLWDRNWSGSQARSCTRL